MGIIQYARGILLRKRAEPNITLHEPSHAASHMNGPEATLVRSSRSTVQSRTVQYLMKRGKTAELHVLAKLHIIDSAVETCGINLRRHGDSATMYGRYVPVRLLRSGGNGEVHLCRYAKTGTLVAVKTIYHGELMAPPNEVHLLHLLGQHTNIIRYHTMLSHSYQEYRMRLVFEFRRLGDLADYVGATTDDTSEMFLWYVLITRQTGCTNFTVLIS